MSGRITLIMAVLVLAGVGLPTPAVQAEESSEAALKRQLEEVRQQLQELQLKVQRMETELNAAQASSPAAVSAAPATPAAGSQPPAPAAPPGIGAAPMPSTPTAPSPAAPSTGGQPSAAPLRVEAGTSPPQPAVPEAFQWREKIKDQWRSVKAGMSSQEIRALLGTPSREFTVDGKPVWYYSYPGIGNGSVLFSLDGHTVVGWQHPPFGFW